MAPEIGGGPDFRLQLVRLKAHRSQEFAIPKERDSVAVDAEAAWDFVLHYLRPCFLPASVI